MAKVESGALRPGEKSFVDSKLCWTISLGRGQREESRKIIFKLQIYAASGVEFLHILIYERQFENFNSVQFESPKQTINFRMKISVPREYPIEIWQQIDVKMMWIRREWANAKTPTLVELKKVSELQVKSRVWELESSLAATKQKSEKLSN